MNWPIRVASTRSGGSTDTSGVSACFVGIEIMDEFEVSKSGVGIVRVQSGGPLVTKSITFSSFDGACSVNFWWIMKILFNPSLPHAPN